MTGTAISIRGDARALPLPDNTVDLFVTSPPYFGLRSYQDGGQHYPGQVGSEATPAEFLEALWACTREWVRVLKPEGSMWVNLGDKYAEGQRRMSAHGQSSKEIASHAGRVAQGRRAENPIDERGIRAKSLLGIPWRYAIGCIDQLGLILRAEIIWSKPNGLPESVTDRVRRSHEQWFHLVKQPRYYSAVDEIREAHSEAWGPIDRIRGRRNVKPDGTPDGGMVERPNPLGKLPGSVWTIPTEPLQVPAHLGVDHFAAFPLEWPRRIIAGWSPPGICTGCGQGRRPVGQRSDDYAALRRNAGDWNAPLYTPGIGYDGSGNRRPTALRPSAEVAITGYSCACPTPDAPTRPAVVLDPFGGTGTVALAARALGRTGVSIDLSHDYSRLAQWRTTNKYELAKALQIDRPPIENLGQLDLLEGLL